MAVASALHHVLEHFGIYTDRDKKTKNRTTIYLWSLPLRMKLLYL